MSEEKVYLMDAEGNSYIGRVRDGRVYAIERGNKSTGWVESTEFAEPITFNYLAKISGFSIAATSRNLYQLSEETRRWCKQITWNGKTYI